MQVPGVAFRGRIFMEIFTKPSYSVGVFNDVMDSPPDSKSKVEVGLGNTSSSSISIPCFLIKGVYVPCLKLCVMSTDH